MRIAGHEKVGPAVYGSGQDLIVIHIRNHIQGGLYHNHIRQGPHQGEKPRPALGRYQIHVMFLNVRPRQHIRQFFQDVLTAN